MNHRKSSEVLEEPSLALRIANRYLIWIMVIVVAVTLLVSYTFILGGEIANVIDAAEENLPAKEKVLRDLQEIKRDLDDVVREFDLIKNSKNDIFARFNQLLPERSQYLELFTMVDDITRKSGMKMTSINISLEPVSSTRNMRRDNFAQAGPEGEVLEVGGLEGVKTMTVNIAVEGGGYDAFKGYLDSLEKSVRLFDVRSVSFSGSSFVVSPQGAPQTAQYTIELVSYYRE